MPKGCKAHQWKKLVELKRSMHRVEYATHGSSVLQCGRNPYGLMCRGCKGFSHNGICKHCMACTHIIEMEKPEDDRDNALNLELSMRPLNRGEDDLLPSRTSHSV